MNAVCKTLCEPQHAGHIGSVLRISQQHVFQIGGAHAGPHGNGEKVDDFFGSAAKQVRAEDLAALLFYGNLVAGICLGDSAGLIPTGGHFMLHVKLETLLVCFAFA